VGNVGILLNDKTAPQGIIESTLAHHHIAYDILDVVEQPLPSVDAYTAIVVLGGAQHVYEPEQYPYLVQEQAYIQQLIARNVPTLGICLGAQLIASALGARVYQHTLEEIGFYDVEITVAGQQDPLFAGFTTTLKVFHWHEDTFDLPVGTTLLNTHPDARHQAFRYGANTYGVQYHIELDQTILNTWLDDPSLKESILTYHGPATYHALLQEKEVDFSTYRMQSDRLFENFLRISKLIS
jgi:GMP synthase-like glutamine amidotransferase